MNWRSEYKKCLLDTSRKHMIETYLLNSTLWLKQDELLSNIITNERTIVTKSRNVGFTTLLAAYTACELAINSDGKNDNDYSIVYVALNINMLHEFRKKVLLFLDLIPTELFSQENKSVTIKPDSIIVGKSTLIFTLLQESNQYALQRSFQNKKNVDLLIFDEPVIGGFKWINEYDVKSFLDALQYSCEKMVVGGTPNHKNKWWFDVITEAKKMCSYLIIPWYTNKAHRVNDEDLPKLHITHDGVEEYTNEWFEKRKFYINNSDAFEEEINCKVWKEKVVKEFV